MLREDASLLVLDKKLLFRSHVVAGLSQVRTRRSGIMKRLLLTLLFFTTVVTLLELKGARGIQAVKPLLTIDCGPACDYRCSKASRAKLCLRYCNVCCQRCNCVPPGTAGNKEICPCYANMMSSKGTPKCP